jgi:hypothetical protein
MTYKECIDFIISEFIPTHLFGNVKESKKYSILNNILIDCLKIFTEKILQKHIIPIIDNHAQEANISILQNLFLDIILLEKDKMYARFVNPEKRNHMIPTELYNTIQAQLKKLSESNKKLVVDNINLKKDLENMAKLAESETERLKNLGLEVIEQNKQLTNEKNTLLEKLYKYENDVLVKQEQGHMYQLEQERKQDVKLEHQYRLEHEQKKKQTEHECNSNHEQQRLLSCGLGGDMPRVTSPPSSINVLPSHPIGVLPSVSDSESDTSIPRYQQPVHNLIKHDLNEKHEEFLNEMNDDDVSGFVTFT